MLDSVCSASLSHHDLFTLGRSCHLQRTTTSQTNRALLNAFLVLNLVGIAFVAQPYSYQPKTLVNEVTGGYMRFIGLWQHWDMFSPGPRCIRIRMDAVVTLRDGSERTWTFPQMDSMGVFERFRKERYRKWAFDGVRSDREQAIWHPTALFVARQFDDARHPPIRVRLSRYWRFIPPPTDLAIDPDKMPEHRFTFYDTKLETPRNADLVSFNFKSALSFGAAHEKL
jgi:hypothetical protein